MSPARDCHRDPEVLCPPLATLHKQDAVSPRYSILFNLRSLMHFGNGPTEIGCRRRHVADVWRQGLQKEDSQLRKLQKESRPTPPHLRPASNSCLAAVDTVLWPEQKGSRRPGRNTATSMPEATSEGHRSNDRVASLSNQRKRTLSRDYFWKESSPGRLRGSYRNFLTANDKN